MKATVLVILASLALLAATGAAAPAGVEQDAGFRSTALGRTIRFEVYLPADYATGRRRYPVIYFLHGLPSSEDAYKSVTFVERALDATGRRAILVAPQGATVDKPDPEYLEGWETALARELPRAVDAQFRTIPSRRGRALIGLSAGGYGAMHLGLQNLDLFSVVESWSGYFHPTDPSGTKALSLGSPDADARADVHEQVRANRQKLRALPTFIGFYVGRSDERFAKENVQLNRELTSERVDHVFRIYSGGHEQSLWSSQATAWLRLALGHLAPAGA
jgi:S-formylglutathione hydrolase FrmB